MERFACLGTEHRNEFLAIGGDLRLRMMDGVAAPGAAFAFPSQTLYFTRDQGLDVARSTQSEEEVRRWRAGHKVPCPPFDPGFRQAHRETLQVPPAGPATGKAAGGAIEAAEGSERW